MARLICQRTCIRNVCRSRCEGGGGAGGSRVASGLQRPRAVVAATNVNSAPRSHGWRAIGRCASFAARCCCSPMTMWWSPVIKGLYCRPMA